MADLVGVVYAGIVALGGIVGYLKAGSTASFIAGVGSGFVAALGAFNSNFYVLAGKLGVMLNCSFSGISGLLTAAMGFRFYNSGKVVPAGLVTVLR